MSAKDKRVVMIIAPKNFRDEEYVYPHAALQLAGADITVASTHRGMCTGMLGAKVEADATIQDVADDNWDLVVIVGGNGANIYWDDPVVHGLVKDTVARKVPLAAICISPSTLAHAGVLKGVRATAWKDREQDLKDHGAIWTGEAVTKGTSAQGSPILTGNGPKAAFAFGQELCKLL